jgi:predicted AAA+ superfamily ATPase
MNLAQLGRNLDLDQRTAAGYLDLLDHLMLVRRLPPWHANLGKRLVRAPKVYVRDSGLVHALLGIPDKEALLSHPVVGASWEGFIIENLAAALPETVTPHYFRTAAGAEIDLVLAWPGDRLWAVEIKRSLAPKLERGFHAACADLEPERKFVVYPGTERYRMGEDTEAIPLPDLAALLSGQ